MPYVKQTWTNAPSTASPLSAARLNYMEDGIETASTPLVEDIIGLAVVAETGNYDDLDNTPEQKTFEAYAVDGVYPTAPATAQVRHFYGLTTPPTGAGGALSKDLWTKTPADFNAAP